MRFLATFLAALALTANSPASRAAIPADTLMPEYLKISAALAADDLGAARSAAKDLAGVAAGQHDAAIGAAANAVAKAENLSAAREAFKKLSAPIVAIAKPTRKYFILNCSMAGADWVQTNGKVANPYFGSDMLTCGSVTDEPAP
jgi:hypothetical protein